MSSIKEIRALRLLCEEYGLEGRSILIKYSDAELAAIFNGIGPDFFPGEIRSLLDALHPSLLSVSMIHDTEYSESDGGKASFDASNARFLRNGRKAAKARFAWYDPRRYLVMWDARRYAKVCQAFGWTAWTQAHEKRTKGE